MSRLMKSAAAVLLALLLLCGAALAQEPVYGSTRAFAALLREADIAYEAFGVDEDGDDSLGVAQHGRSVMCFFGEDGQSASFIVWYLIEYAPADEDAVIRACNSLNAASGGPCFYADSSDCTVTATLDVAFPWDAAGMVSYRAFRALADMLPQALEALSPYDVTQPAATPTPIATPTAAPTAVPTAAPTEVPAAVSAATPAPAPQTGSEPASVVITAQSARVRTGPSTTSPYLCTVKKGEVFPVIGVIGDWYIIDCDGRTGFVSASVVRVQ